MRLIVKTMLLMSFAAVPATQTLAASTLHIERQCTRYGNFCGTESAAPTAANLPAPQAKPKPNKAKTPKVVHRTSKPFIERQCDRYGHFC